MIPEWKMETAMYEAICNVKRVGALHPLMSQSKTQRETWEKRLMHFTLREDGGLMWCGLKVPTVPQMLTVLNPIHLEKEIHRRDVDMLRKALSDKGFVLPPFTGGLKRAVEVLVSFVFLANNYKVVLIYYTK